MSTSIQSRINENDRITYIFIKPQKNRIMPDTAMNRPEKIYFYGTCLIDVLYPRAGLSAIQLIEREGVEVLFPQAQSCCGQPPYNSGYREEALAVASEQLALFSLPIPIVVPSGSCAGMMKHHYPALFKNHPLEPLANAVAERVFEFSEFLHRVLNVSFQDLGEPVNVALHTSCSSRREMHVTEDGKALLNQLANVQWEEPVRAEECCGFGGTFSVKQPEISAAMAEDKCRALAETGAKNFVSGDCGCLMNLNGMLQKKAATLSGTHLAEFLWQRTCGGGRS